MFEKRPCSRVLMPPTPDPCVRSRWPLYLNRRRWAALATTSTLVRNSDLPVGGRERAVGGREGGVHDRVRVAVQILEAAEVERPILDHRPTQRRAETLLVERRLPCRELGSGLPGVRPNEGVATSGQLVAAGARDDIDDPAGGLAELGIELARQDLEFLNPVLRERHALIAEPLPLGRYAVDEIGVLEVAAAADVDAAVDPGLRDAGRQRGQVVEVAIDHRRAIDLIRLDDAGQGVLAGLELGRAAFDHDALGEAGDGQHEIDRHGGPHVEDLAAPEARAEPAELGPDVIGAGRQIEQGIAPVRIAHDAVLDTGRIVHRGDGRAGHTSTAVVGDGTGQDGVQALTGCGRG